MGQHPDYRDAPSASSFEQELGKVDVIPFSASSRDVAFDAEMEEISRREGPIWPMFVVITIVITLGMTFGLFFGIPAVMNAVHSKKSAVEDSPAPSSPPVVAPVENTEPVQPDTIEPITIIGTWSVGSAGNGGVPTDMVVAFSDNGSGSMKSSDGSSPFIWKEEEPNTFHAYGDVSGTMNQFKSATFVLDGDHVVVTEWQDSTGVKVPNAVLVQ